MNLEKFKTGWIGLGKMGNPMSKQILKAGFPLRVYNRSSNKMKALLIWYHQQRCSRWPCCGSARRNELPNAGTAVHGIRCRCDCGYLYRA